MLMVTKLETMVTYEERLLLIEPNDLIIIWYCEIT